MSADFFIPDPNELVEWRGFKALAFNLPPPRPGIYLLLHLDTLRGYIGVSQNISNRAREHASGHVKCSRLREALREYGSASFAIIPLFISLTNARGLTRIESNLIADYDAVERGLNIQKSSGGAGPYGSHFGEIVARAAQKPETKAKKSASITAALARPDIRARYLAAMSDPEMRKRHKQSLKDALAPDTKEGRRRRAELNLLRQRPDIKVKILFHVTGCIYITNGQDIKRATKDCAIPVGWARGVPKRIRITNGTHERTILETSQIPIGWKRGRKASFYSGNTTSSST